MGEDDKTVDTDCIHPLESNWTIWYDRRQGGGTQSGRKREQENYENNLQEVGRFESVEEFWSLYNHLIKPSAIPAGSNYHLFKTGIKPMWEDPQNAKGGKWILMVKGSGVDKGALDRYWDELVYALVGETADLEDEICGAVVSRRRGVDKIAVWNRNKDKEEAIQRLGKQIQELLKLPEDCNMEYHHHEDSMKTGASYSNARMRRGASNASDKGAPKRTQSGSSMKSEENGVNH